MCDTIKCTGQWSDVTVAACLTWGHWHAQPRGGQVSLSRVTRANYLSYAVLCTCIAPMMEISMLWLNAEVAFCIDFI